MTIAIAWCCLAPAASAQTDAVTSPPPNMVIANYNATAVGPFGGLEGTAYVARVADPSAAWFNPAGLTRQGAPQISGSAGVYQRTSVAPEALPNEGGSLQQLPNFVGFTFVPRPGLTIGAAFLSTNAWDQQTDSELIAAAGGSQRRLAYSADSGFETRVAAGSVGYHGGGRWRVGGGIAFSMMHLRLVQSASDRIADTVTVRSRVVEAHASGSAIQLRAQSGAQYDVGRWRLGIAARSPGLMIWKSGSIVFDGVLAGESQSIGASLFDADARLDYHLPWEFQGGAAFASPRFEVEFDVHGYTPIDAYQLLSSEEPVRLYADAPGQSPTLETRAFAGLTSASTGVVNIGAGGHVRLLADRDLRLHAGIGSNQSPVAPEDTVFTKVDLTTWSVGLSGTLGNFQFAAGLNRQSGVARDVILHHLIDGEEIRSPIVVRMYGFIYSLAYQF